MINFLDVSVILHSDGTIETDIYYKDTNAHDHSKDNVPYNLPKRIFVFVSNEDKIEYRLNDLKSWLKSCKYPNILLIELFVMQDYKVKHPLKQIQIIFHL